MKAFSIIGRQCIVQETESTFLFIFLNNLQIKYFCLHMDSVFFRKLRKFLYCWCTNIFWILLQVLEYRAYSKYYYLILNSFNLYFEECCNNSKRSFWLWYSSNLTRCRMKWNGKQLLISTLGNPLMFHSKTKSESEKTCCCCVLYYFFELQDWETESWFSSMNND